MRDIYRDKINAFEDQVIKLETKLAKAKKITGRQNRERSSHDSNKDTRQRYRDIRLMEFQRQTPNPPLDEYDFIDMHNANHVIVFTAPSANARTNVSTIVKGMNKRWLDVDLFHDTHDRKN
jgi:hypothetical protein